MFARVVLLMFGILHWSAAMSVSPQPQKCKTATGRIYNIGDVFTDNGCTTTCECMNGGIIACQAMCRAAKAIPCANMKIKHIPVDLPDAQNKSCSCPLIICEPDLCSDGKTKYKPGESFISSDCSGSCFCHPGGVVTCVSLCPPTAIRCGHDEEEVKASRKIPNSNCTCPQWRCVKKKQRAPNQLQARLLSEKQCLSSNGKIYSVGDVFTDNKCTSKCECKNGGTVSCKPLCLVLPKNNFCAKQSIMNVPIKLPDAEGRSCSCPLVICEAFEAKEQVYRAAGNDRCFDGGKSFKAGERFISADCSSSCKCRSGGVVSCVSLCPPTLIKCMNGEEKIQSSRKIPNSNCTCPQWECVKRKRKLDVCIDGGRVYNPGENLISSDCAGNCTCESGALGGGIGIACKPLCPNDDVICGPDESKKQWTEQIPNSKCTCTRWKCVKKADEFCEVFGERHKIGERFVGKNCNGYCWCTGPLGFGCVSLCPPHGIYCRSGTRKVRTTIPAFPGSTCTCPSWKCVRVESKWRPWSNWTACDAKCGGGLRYRFRTCTKNAVCLGPSTETEVCNVTPCSPSYNDAPCGAQRMNLAEGNIWPRCDDQGYFEPLQCNPSASECWCADKLGNVEPGTKLLSQKPQCIF